MSELLDFNLSDVTDEKVLPPGEHAIKIIDASHEVSKNSGNPMLRLIIGITDEEDVANIFHYIVLPGKEDDDSTRNRKLRRFRDFITAIGMDISGPVDTDLIKGQTGWAMLKEEDDAEFGQRNTISRFSAGA